MFEPNSEDPTFPTELISMNLTGPQGPGILLQIPASLNEDVQPSMFIAKALDPPTKCEPDDGDDDDCFDETGAPIPCDPDDCIDAAGVPIPDCDPDDGDGGDIPPPPVCKSSYNKKKCEEAGGQMVDGGLDAFGRPLPKVCQCP